MTQIVLQFILLLEPLAKQPRERPRRKWNDDLKMVLMEKYGTGLDRVLGFDVSDCRSRVFWLSRFIFGPEDKDSMFL